MVPVDEALKRALDSVSVLPPVDMALADIRAGMVLAEPVTALEPVPSYAASVMDGYAVLAADGPGDYRVLGASTAGGDGQKVQVTSGTIVRIATGAPLPPGADAVVMVEDTQLVERDAAGEEVRVRVLAKAVRGQYIRPVGHDVAAGCKLLAAGTVVTSAGGEVGAMALSGHTHFRMHGVPRVGVLSTGDELVSDGSQLASGRVRDSNRPALVCALRALGCVVEDLGVAPDDAEQLARVLDKALRTCHGVVTSGGVSMGERDALRPAVARLGGSEVFGRVLMKPAKPTMFAAMPQGRFVCGLPGNPASAVVALHMFAVPVLRKMLGHPGGIDSLRPNVQAVLRVRDPLVLDRLRPEYVRARLAWDKSRAEWVASVGDTRQQSSRMASMVAANALVALPLGTDERPEVRDGVRLTAIVIAPVFFE
ncbi:molybdopterin molybdotransferase activity protein [Coemansia sp. RSA 2703]|nr:molybdopterin molybdotransferase activity protein [Coemansia sp. RSA 2703]